MKTVEDHCLKRYKPGCCSAPEEAAFCCQGIKVANSAQGGIADRRVLLCFLNRRCSTH